MAKKNEQAEVSKPDAESSEGKLKRYEDLFEELTRFTTLIEGQDAEMIDAAIAVEDAKAVYNNKKKALEEIASIRDGAKHNLYRFLSPKNGRPFESLPLFDTMDVANDTIHGKNSTQWRLEPVSAIGVSLLQMVALNDSDVMMVGHLQDRVMASPEDWWKGILGLNAGSEQAIIGRLNDFIYSKTTE